jgi:DNA repair exonuclease SbcCD ATPase subunit/DNA repair exonuclease SbcCD nuclease subunit
MENTESEKKTRKPRQPKQPKQPIQSNPINTVTQENSNIDCSKIESIHIPPEPTANSKTNIIKSKKTIAKRSTKKESAEGVSLNSIIKELDISTPTTNPDNNQEVLNSLSQQNTHKIIKLSSGAGGNITITHIYHISDIHIQLYKRHQEYREVFQRVYDYLIGEKTASGIPTTQNRNIPFLVVITGDILHSKADLSPECIQLTYSFIKTLASIMPVVLIAGNHDININNRDRLDSLTPILADLPAVAPVYYLLESGIYQLNNILFYYSSILDSNVVIQPRVQTPMESGIESGITSGIVHIGLYHGRVNGAVYFNGMECRDSESGTGSGTSGNKTITPSAFADYDITLLGDIHKYQFMTPNIAYAGSLIQQNIGEDIKGHGLIKWSLADKIGSHIAITNDWSYVSIHVDNKKANFLCTAADGTHAPDCPLTKNISLRILYRNTPESYLGDYITLMKMNHNIVDFRWNCDDSQQPIPLSLDSTQPDSTNAANGNVNTNMDRGNKNRTSLVDITSPEVQFTYLADIIREYYPDITPTELDSIKTINQEQNDQLRATNKQFSTQGFNGHYKILRLEFSNLFSFGDSNIIEFREFQGIVGIIAPNHLGKSSILDIIVYTLFDEFTRKGSVKDIININRDDFSIRMELQIGEWIYTIQKTGQRTKIGASVQVRFSRKNAQTGVLERLEEDSVLKTKEKILEYFGCYEDMIHTSFSIQHDNACFIDSSNVKRKEELERIMRFEIVKKLYEQVNQRFNRDKAVYEHIKKKVNGDELVRLKKEKSRLNKLLDIITTDREYARARIRALHQSILEESGKLHKDCDAFLADNDESETRELLESLEEELLENENQLESLKSNQSSQSSQLANADPDELKKQEAVQTGIIAETNKKMKAITQSLEKLYKTRKPINTKLEPNTTLADHHTKLILAKQRLETELTATNQSITELKELEVQNQTRQEQILALEKQKTRLPPQLQAILDKANEEGVDMEYMKEVFHEALEEFASHLPRNPMVPCAFSKYIVESAEYNSLCRAARDFFLYQELVKYQQQSSNSTDASIKSRQAQLDSEFSVTKKHISTKLPVEDAKRNTLSGKLATLGNQIKLLETDLSNTEANSKLDEEIQTLQTKRTRYETQIEGAETELQAIRTRSLALVEIEKLELASRRLAMEIKDAASVLEQFETYRGQIEANKPIQNRIAALKAELAEFEEVLELVEARMQKEQNTQTEIISKLEQMKRDTLEGRDLEAKLRLLEIYRAGLKELPYILLGKIQPLLEKKVNDLLAITTDFSVRFDMSDSKIDIYLDRAIYKDKSRAILINNASGFERFMASLSIRLALLELSNLPKINFIAIDEGWSSFDTHNINNVSLILDYLTSKFDFVLTISHLIQIKEHCDMQISLRRDERGFSKIIY